MIHSSHQEIREFNRHSFDYLVKFQLYANFNSTALHTKQPKNLTESVSFYHHLKKNIYIHNTPKQNSFLLKIAKFSSSLFHQTWVGKKKKKKSRNCSPRNCCLLQLFLLFLLLNRNYTFGYQLRIDSLYMQAKKLTERALKQTAIFSTPSHKRSHLLLQAFAKKLDAEITIALGGKQTSHSQNSKNCKLCTFSFKGSCKALFGYTRCSNISITFPAEI